MGRLGRFVGDSHEAGLVQLFTEASVRIHFALFPTCGFLNHKGGGCNDDKVVVAAPGIKDFLSGTERAEVGGVLGHGFALVECGVLNTIGGPLLVVDTDQTEGTVGFSVFAVCEGTTVVACDCGYGGCGRCGCNDCIALVG